MAAYVIVFREDLVDPAGYDTYLAAAAPSLEGRNLKLLAFNGKTRSIEGGGAKTGVLIEFPTFEEAEEWYDSKLYQEALPIRLKAGSFRSIILDGVPAA